MVNQISVAVMADIHSNYEAFRSCIHTATKKGVQQYIFLGDYLGDLAFPQKTLKLMKELKREYPCLFIRGNKEEYWINHRKNRDEIWKTGVTGTGMLCYNYENISDEDIDFFEGMPISKAVQYGGFPEFVVCHGSPFQVNQSMRPDYAYIDDLTKKLSTELTLCGHFHRQMDYTRNGRRVLNPGSIGVPLRSPGKAQFLILHGRNGSWEIEFLSVPYDVEQAIAEMDKEKLYQKAPGWYQITKHLLRTGEHSHAAIAARAAELYHLSSTVPTQKDIPEKYWEMAIAELGAFDNG